MTEENARSNRQNRLADRPLRLISTSQASAVPTPPVSPPSPASPALRRLQQDLEAARAEARSLREILDELPAILERKFQQRLQALLSEQRQLEQENAHLHQQWLALLGGHRESLNPPAALPGTMPPSRPEPEPEDTDDAPITAGLGLRRALRRLHR